jgi:hypothetical protein
VKSLKNFLSLYIIPSIQTFVKNFAAKQTFPHPPTAGSATYALRALPVGIARDISSTNRVDVSQVSLGKYHADATLLGALEG